MGPFQGHPTKVKSTNPCPQDIINKFIIVNGPYIDPPIVGDLGLRKYQMPDFVGLARNRTSGHAFEVIIFYQVVMNIYRRDSEGVVFLR